MLEFAEEPKKPDVRPEWVNEPKEHDFLPKGVWDDLTKGDSIALLVESEEGKQDKFSGEIVCKNTVHRDSPDPQYHLIGFSDRVLRGYQIISIAKQIDGNYVPIYQRP